ncbi:MAG TPA: nucleotidyltransferase domain-containing protein [Blastocatellia bacterium]|nr:nucleotidyltransferase domain-containing protein [Blastocatellia bacterium]
MKDQLANVPDNVRSSLNDFVESTRSAFADDLRSIVLYGSAAEGRLRNTSDVNLLIVNQLLGSSVIAGCKRREYVATRLRTLN